MFSIPDVYLDILSIDKITNTSLISKKVLNLQLYFSKILINEKARITKGDTKLSVYIAKYRGGQ